MLFQVIAMSVITLLLFFLLLTRKPGRINLLLGACTTVCGIASMVLFILFQRANGNPDAGRELIQLYLPCGLYVAVSAWGAIEALRSRKKLLRDKAARQAAKEKAAREKAAPSKTEPLQ